MTIEQFKNNWQPQMDGYARFSFNLDLKELVQQIRADAEAEQKAMCESCIHKVSADDIKAIRDSVIDECIAIVNFHKNEYDGICWAIRELEELKEKINELPDNTNVREK